MAAGTPVSAGDLDPTTPLSPYLTPYGRPSRESGEISQHETQPAGESSAKAQLAKHNPRRSVAHSSSARSTRKRIRSDRIARLTAEPVIRCAETYSTDAYTCGVQTTRQGVVWPAPLPLLAPLPHRSGEYHRRAVEIGRNYLFARQSNDGR